MCAYNGAGEGERDEKRFGFFGVLMLACGGAYAGGLMNSNLMSYCAGKDDSEYRGICIGFIISDSQRRVDYTEGFIEGAVHANNNVSRSVIFTGIEYANARYACEAAVSYAEMADIFVKWLKRNPDQLGESASSGLKAAMLEAYPPPCK